jgi:hypothetical protein
LHLSVSEAEAFLEVFALRVVKEFIGHCGIVGEASKKLIRRRRIKRQKRGKDNF